MEKLFKAQVRTLTNIINFYENSTTKVAADRRTLEHFEARLELLESYWRAFIDRHDELYEYEDALKDQDYYKKDFSSLTKDAFTSAKPRLTARVRTLKAQRGASPPRPQPVGTQFDRSSLPTLALPTFSGKHEEWESFKQRFTSLIRNNDSISTVDKLQHLLNAVQDEAAQRLKGLEITVANFEIAWEKLVRRYDKTRIRLFNNLEKLISLPPVRARNVQDLNAIIDRAEEAIRALRDLGCPVDHYDNWLVHCITRKLDHSSRESWELSQQDRAGFSTYANLSSFLERRIHSSEQARTQVDQDRDTTRKSASSRASGNSRRVSVHAAQAQNPPANKTHSACVFCGERHWLYACSKFAALSQPKRLEFCKRQKLCLNCLQKSHFLKNCPSSKRCSKCQAKHYTKLHADSASLREARNSPDAPTQSTDTAPEPQTSESALETPSTSISAHTIAANGAVLLATAKVIIPDPSGNTHVVRALIDPAAERSFIAQRAVAQLKLDQKRVAVSVFGVGASIASNARAEVHLILKSSKDKQFRTTVSALVLNELTRYLPRNKIIHACWPHIKGLDLADPQFPQPGKVDLILAADVYPIIILEGLIRGPIGTPVAQKSVFGWLFTGHPSADAFEQRDLQLRVFHTFTKPSISEILVRFWELEEIPPVKLLTATEKQCEEHFMQTYSRNDEGRFVVRLPFSADPKFVGSRDIAVACLIHSERRLQRNTHLAELYRAFMNEYRALHHMEIVQEDHLNHPSFYLPHHAVFRPDNPNKIRVVFNASQKASNGVSLNDMLLPGPRLQADVSVVLSHWRFFRLAFTTDVVKMFRQILIHPDDADWQRIVWRPDVTRPIQDYRATTVTYGTASAPFLALRVMRQLADDGEKSHPEAAAILRHQLYVDDIFAGAHRIEEAIHRRDQLIQPSTSAGCAAH